MIHYFVLMDQIRSLHGTILETYETLCSQMNLILEKIKKTIAHNNFRECIEILAELCDDGMDINITDYLFEIHGTLCDGDLIGAYNSKIHDIITTAMWNIYNIQKYEPFIDHNMYSLIIKWNDLKPPSTTAFKDAVFAIIEARAPVEGDLVGLTANDIAGLSTQAAKENDPNLGDEDLADIDMNDLRAVVDLNNHKLAYLGWTIFVFFDSEYGYAQRARETIKILDHHDPVNYIKDRMVSIEQARAGYNQYLWYARDDQSFIEVQDEALAFIRENLHPN